MTHSTITYLDALHGDVTLDEAISSLVHAPIVQRLRHVRLSNIDSVSMPGIANISRYEHVIGVAHLAARIGFRRRIPVFEHQALVAAALLHDWAITAFGHLVEEAFNYLDLNFHHESKLQVVLRGDHAGGDALREDLQILEGRQTDLTPWARRTVGTERESELLSRIEETIRGTGRFGRVVCGTMDLDNIDNVYRMAFHMGLPIDRAIPLRLAEAIVDTDDAGAPVFAKSVDTDVAAWVGTRREIYRRLMPAQPDFSYKTMLIFATIKEVAAGGITSDDWKLTDAEFLSRLSSSEVDVVRETVSRWRAGEAWDTTPLWWLQGKRPTYSALHTFSEELTEALGRPCLAYGIKDKRERRLEFSFDDGSSVAFGSDPSTWLLGVGSPRRAAFTRQQSAMILEMARARFAPFADVLPAVDVVGGVQETCLL